MEQQQSREENEKCCYTQNPYQSSSSETTLVPATRNERDQPCHDLE
eukprot:CAMPEP_0115712176 /NCGR_PEP_ID=MMETSP0272-20121206/73981_1 /TAXON_ID=71861 /ORGANISM="Scrippsiella trochoidea, Strain CCMP3099" /LENGTH=45 /DNA_ID= /DNA_START= /DNA_END= /DNA_ORIENTATION=